jgi:hypothetical protein
MYFDALEDSVRDVRIATDQAPLRGERLRLDHDQAAGAVGEGTGEDDLPLLRQWFEMGEVRRSMLGALFLRVSAVVTDDDE